MGSVHRLLLLASVARAHVGLFHPSIFGFNGAVTGRVDEGTQVGVTPSEQQTFDGFWMQSWLDVPHFPPLEDNFLELPAGGQVTVELAHGRSLTTFNTGGNVTRWMDGREHVDTPDQPYQGTPGEGPGGGPGCISVDGIMHVQNRTMAAGSAIAISYTSDINRANISNTVVISIAEHSPFERLTPYNIPAGLPGCPPGGCICAWLWIPNGCGSPNEYMQPMRCNVTGAIAANTLGVPRTPLYCGANKQQCITGAKSVIVYNQKSGNNTPVVGGRVPAYSTDYGFLPGAQSDIFVSPVVTPTAFTPRTYTATRTYDPIITTTASPTVVPNFRSWTQRGCYNDSSSARGLQYSYSNQNMTIAACVKLAKSYGFRYAAVEFGAQCYFGSTLASTSVQISLASCNMRCPGNQGQICGGSNAMIGYEDTQWTQPTWTQTTSSTPTPTATTLAGSGNFKSRGCVADNNSQRLLSDRIPENSTVTALQCINFGRASHFRYAGVEAGGECYVGNNLTVTPATSTACTSPCSDGANWCGGSFAMNLYEDAAWSPYTVNGYTLQGCYSDRQTQTRALPNSAVNANMTVEMCLSLAAGATYFGVEYGSQCYYGNVLQSTSQLAGGCTSYCGGNSSEICGGSYTMSLYKKMQ